MVAENMVDMLAYEINRSRPEYLSRQISCKKVTEKSDMKTMLVMGTILAATMEQLSVDFQQLRKIKGHFDGGEYNADVDGFQGKKHSVLLKLGEILGKPGTESSLIVQYLGQPDETEAEGVVLMPGPYMVEKVGHSGSEPSIKLIYNWRGKHDYLYFKVDPVSQLVEKSGWYHAGE